MKIEWEEIARRGKNHAVLVMDEVVESYKEKLGQKNLPGFVVKNYRQFNGARWFGRDDIENYVQALENLEDKKEGSLLKLAQKYIALLDEKRNWIKKVSKLDFSKMSNEKLCKIFKENFEQNKKIMSYAYHYIMLNKFYPDQLVGEIAKKVPDLHHQNEILKILFALDKPSEVRKEKESILKIAQLLQGKKYTPKSEKIQKMIREHLKKFAHIGVYYFWGAPFEPKDIEKRLKDLVKKDLSKEINDLKEQKLTARKTQAIIKELNLDEKTKLMIKTIKTWAFAANHFDETYNFIVCGLWNFWKELQKRFNLSYGQVVSMRGQEILELLKTGEISNSFKKELADRFEDHALILSDGKIVVLSGESLKAYYKKEKAEEEDYSKIKELKGQSASPGLARGMVHLVLSIDEVPKVKKGEILVAAATAPSFVPAMERAAAIVTNEGGLLSHAAIVSRELGIPCVVGTKIGTKALRDGDKIEVDANKGIVRKV
jgi:phosphohistidine swiveling domain-containing protein